MKTNGQTQEGNVTFCTSDSREYVVRVRSGKYGQDIQILPVFSPYLLPNSGIVGTGSTLELIYLYRPSPTGGEVKVKGGAVMELEQVLVENGISLPVLKKV
jgi:hypothetical protein